MSNKLLASQLKTFINSLKADELETLLLQFQESSQNEIKIDFHQKGYKCYEAKIILQDISASGFGRDQNEANLNAIKGFFDNVLEQKHEQINVIKECFRIIKQPNISSNSNNNNNTNNFSMSYVNQFNNVSFDLEPLSQKIGNISAININNQLNISQNNDLVDEEPLIQFFEKNNTLKNKNPLEKKQNLNKLLEKDAVAEVKKIFESDKENNKLTINLQKNNNTTTANTANNITSNNTLHETKNTSNLNHNTPTHYNNCGDKQRLQFCVHEEELKKERMKTDHLEKRIKLITEENNILKSLLIDQSSMKQQEAQLSIKNVQNFNITDLNKYNNDTVQKSNLLSTMKKQEQNPVIQSSYNVQPISNNNQQQQIADTSKTIDFLSFYQKHQQVQQTKNELNKRDIRSQSTDPQIHYEFLKQSENNKSFNQNESLNTSTNDFNAKKPAVPKLNLEILPNFHGKFNQSLNSYLLNMYNKKHKKNTNSVLNE